MGAVTNYRCLACLPDITDAAELFAGGNIADVYLYTWNPDSLEGVKQGYAGVGICSRVEDYAVYAVKKGLLNPVHKGPFVI